MAFETLSETMRQVAQRSLAACKQKYGGNGVKLEEGIDNKILWRPTFQLRPSKTRLLAVEVAENLYPESLRGAAYEVMTFDSPISVYQACTLEAYQSDAKQRMIGILRENGIGIMTVDEDGKVAFQHLCIPLAQHISSLLLEKEMAGMSKPLKVHFRTAHDTYVGNEGQGLQQAGQILEAVVDSIVKQAIKDGTIPAATAAKALADQIDALYATGKFTPHRAALGGAREFVKNFRNIASHPAPSGKQAAEKIRKCRSGFLDAIRHTNQLRQAATSVGYRLAVIL